MFHLNDRKTVIQKQEKKKGITEEITTEQPKTIICKCGHINNIY